MPYFFYFICFFICTSCVRSTDAPQALSSLNLVDRNGMTQTIGSKDRLKNYANVDFQKPQPYQKVLRVYTSRPDGAIPAIVTSYYPSGQIKQSLSVLSGRAQGPYYEWHENGVLKIEAYLVGGAPQLGGLSEQSWIFHGPCKAFNEKGKLMGSMTYERGLLEGESLYWSSEGILLKKMFYEKGFLNGQAEYYHLNGCLEQTITYLKGERHGPLEYYRPDKTLIAQEYYEEGRLQKAIYTNTSITAGVQDSFGLRYSEAGDRFSTEEIRMGKVEGEVREYEKGLLVRSFYLKNGLKEGPESFWTPQGLSVLEIPYREGRIQGEIVTHYPIGALQSRREMSNNEKNGALHTWYLDGQLMMAEEYNHNKLVTGSYYKKGSGFPVSSVVNGEGTATLFDEGGQLDRRISYKDGKPY
ncbi:MAG: hypothetical protein WCN87_04830 [Chlamydiota bacterium]